MSKLSLAILLAVVCTLEANNFFYYPSTAGALNYQYQYQPISPYVYSPIAVPVDCDKSGSSEGGESSESKESGESSESKESGESEESGSSESSEGGESTEGSSSEEGSSEESKEGESSSESSSSSEESGEKKEEKKDNKKKAVQYMFPPVAYQFPPRTAQQIVYSAPSYGYLPYRTYSAIQQPASYAIKSSGYTGYQPYYAGSYTAPVAASIVSSPVNKVVSYPGVSKTITFAPASGVGGPAGYWNGNVGYYRV